MKRIKIFLKNKKGSFSILLVMLCFLGIVITTGLLDIIKTSMVLNEIQSIMDVSGVSSLKSGIDTQKIRLEIFDYDKVITEQNYRKMLYSSIKTGNTISEFQIDYIDIKEYKDNWGLGDSRKSRPQVILDNAIKLRLKSSSIFDNISAFQRTFYNSKSNGDFTITYNGQTKDGRTELIIRSVSRLVYR